MDDQKPGSQAEETENMVGPPIYPLRTRAQEPLRFPMSMNDLVFRRAAIESAK